jgi:hypothetical protein
MRAAPAASPPRTQDAAAPRGRPRHAEPPFWVEYTPERTPAGTPAADVWTLRGPGLAGDPLARLAGDAGHVRLTQRAQDLNRGWRMGWETGYNAGYMRARRAKGETIHEGHE